ncbi:hypothetical protein LF63_0107830 [Oleiagrimonas soli]|uniref:Uncharacterized protein n=1 Tax=Oleiagrimonas soli TaxID=1543381 RepID=A0A099CX15_9GAMM|nr:hypothetical protein LF63_0107830 [Oleiagrimonas soli]
MHRAIHSEMLRFLILQCRLDVQLRELSVQFPSMRPSRWQDAGSVIDGIRHRACRLFGKKNP